MLDSGDSRICPIHQRQRKQWDPNIDYPLIDFMTHTVRRVEVLPRNFTSSSKERLTGRMECLETMMGKGRLTETEILVGETT